MSYSHNPKKSLKNTNKKHSDNDKKKSSLHPRNIHIGRYDLVVLSKHLPELSSFLILNPKGQSTVDFTNPNAVKTLNKALLIHHYNLNYWDIPEGFLCPPIPSRADYIHHIADLLGVSSQKKDKPVYVLDIGTGANCIYPIIGSHCYDWHFVATDIDEYAIRNAQEICDNNPLLKENVELRHQKTPAYIFTSIINKSDKFDITMCNPPFHASLAEAEESNQRKQRNLAYNQQKRNATNNKNDSSTVTVDSNKNLINKSKQNFGGQKAELWCDGGEINFLQRMAVESVDFCHQVRWFTTLVSKSENIYPFIQLLNKLKATTVKEIPMQHGQKTTRVIVWSWQ